MTAPKAVTQAAMPIPISYSGVSSTSCMPTHPVGQTHRTQTFKKRPPAVRISSLPATSSSIIVASSLSQPLPIPPAPDFKGRYSPSRTNLPLTPPNSPPKTRKRRSSSNTNDMGVIKLCQGAESLTTLSDRSVQHYDYCMYKNGRNGVLGDMQATKQEILGLETTRFRKGYQPISSFQQHLHLTSSSINHSLSTINTSKPSSWITVGKLREFAGEYQLGGSGSEIYGKGAWSTVYKATLLTSTPPTNSAIIDLPTPPPSPVNKGFITTSKFLAIKAAGRKDAKPVLEKEARILTYLTANSQKSSQHVADFLGYDTSRSALILEAVPLTLSDYTTGLAATTRQRTTTTSRSEPVIGTRQWLTFTSNLVAGLIFLKDKGVVHGDIKPQNILLREKTPTLSPSTSCDDDNTPTYTPLFADFSSSHVLTPTTLSTSIEEISAVTAEYTAPELLLALRLSNPNRAVATFATDIFALGVTLIQVAIGESCYSGAGNGMMKSMMMNEGRPMEFARGGEGFMRVRKGGLVDRVVGGAVAKKVEERFEVEEWMKVIEGEV